MKQTKPIIYQLFPRLFTNTCSQCEPDGTIEQNGVGKMNAITGRVLTALCDLGVTHVWYTGIIEHAQATDYSRYGIAPDNPHVVKGRAGSPYAIKDYYDIDPDIATSVPDRMREFENLVNRTHRAGLKVIIDFVPNHVARQYYSDVKPAGIHDLGADDNRDMAFAPYNNFYYIPRQLFSPGIDLGNGDDAYYEFPAKATGNDCFSAYPSRHDWYETVKLNYGVDYGNGSRHFDPVPDTWLKMLHILRYWAAKKVDGFRCDMAHMVPVEFWQWAIPQVRQKYPDVIFIAEIYDVGLYRNYIYNGGFDYLYDKVNLYDTLYAIQKHNRSAASLTSCWQTVDGISEHMLNFLENHDEQRVASPQYMGDGAKALPALVVSLTMSVGPFMLYQGQELGEHATDAEGFSGRDGRTTIFDYWSIPTVRRWFNGGKCDGARLGPDEQRLRQRYRQLLRLANESDAIARGAFFDLMYVNYENPDFDPHRVFTFLRKHDDELLLIAVNFADEARHCRINLPIHAFDVLEIVRGEYLATELLAGAEDSVTLDERSQFVTDIEPLGAVIWRLAPKSKKKSAKHRAATTKNQ